MTLTQLLLAYGAIGSFVGAAAYRRFGLGVGLMAAALWLPMLVHGAVNDMRKG